MRGRSGTVLLDAFPRDQALPIGLPVFDERTAISDGITVAAHYAGCLAHWLHAQAGVPVPDDGLLSLDQGRQLYAFVSKIRERATADVLASQLVVLKHRETPDVNWTQRVTLEVFSTLAQVFLKREDEIAGAQLAALETKAEPRPVPIDETNMELVDDRLATWGR